MDNSLRAEEFLLKLLLKKRPQKPDKVVHPRIYYYGNRKEWEVDLLISLPNWETKVVGKHVLKLQLTTVQLIDTLDLFGITIKGLGQAYDLHYNGQLIGKYRVLDWL